MGSIGRIKEVNDMGSIGRILQVIEYMNRHIEGDLTIENFCDVAGYTKSHLIYLFKLYIGETPSKYYYRQKLEHGARLLFGNENIVDIAMRTGYNSHEAFSRAFKREFGMTPVEYRELYDKGLHDLHDLNEAELNIVFMASPAHRVFCSMDEYGKHYDVYKSLVEKGYLDPKNQECTVEGKQLTDKYYWDCSKMIVRLSETYDTLQELYLNAIKIIDIPKTLFYRFTYDLVDVGKIKNIFLGRCGSNCHKCEVLKATLYDDDDIRKKEAVKYETEFNIIIDYTKINCLGCTSNDKLESCEKNCPWTPCCQKYNVTRCNQCGEYPCDRIGELFVHLPEFKENFANENSF